MDAAKPRLIFAYNADSGIVTALIHAVHKQLRPATYPCSLCALTYGLVAMRGEWKRFWQGLAAEVVFHHRDDFTAAYPALGAGGAQEVALPCVLFSGAGEEPRVMIAKAELDAMADVGELIAVIGGRLAMHNVSATAGAG